MHYVGLTSIITIRSIIKKKIRGENEDKESINTYEDEKRLFLKIHV